MVRHSVAVAAIFALASCHSIGPATIGRDHFDYNRAISDSWKEQMLLNMVRLRYGDVPIFLDVASVIAQYSIEGTLSANSASYDRPTVGVPIASTGARYTDRPTVTYQPRTGQQLAKTLLTPISLTSILALVQAGWPIELTLGTTVRAINMVPALKRGETFERNADFQRVVSALGRLSRLGVARVQRTDKRLLYTLRNVDRSEEAQAAAAELRQLLGLDDGVDEYELVTGNLPEGRRQIAIVTSSVIDVLNMLASQFEVPPEHIDRGWTYAPVSNAGDELSIVVHSASQPTEHPFVTTQIYDTWFWIDMGDFRSKRTFSFLVMLMTLVEAGGGAGPIVTIGAGN